MIFLQQTKYGRESRIFCHLCNSEIGLLIPDETISEYYIQQCIKTMNEMPNKLIEDICLAAKAYCLFMMTLTQDKLPDSKMIDVCSDTPAVEILKYFSPVRLIIEKPKDEKKIAYQLECACDWDEEHGMEIDIIQNQLVYLSSFNGYSPWKKYDQSEWNFVNSIK